MDVHDHVDAIHEGPTDASLVGSNASRGTRALVSLVAEVTAGAGVRRRDKLEVAGEHVHAVDAYDTNLVVLQRLAKGLQGVCGELRQLIQEEHPSMGKRNLPRHHWPTTANESSHRDGVMWCAEGTLAALDRIDGLSRHRVNEHRLGTLGIGERRQNRRHPAREHGLAGTRRAHHEYAVPPSGGNDHRALGNVLVGDV